MSNCGDKKRKQRQIKGKKYEERTEWEQIKTHVIQKGPNDTNGTQLPVYFSAAELRL